jgi:hypothetical protein
VNVLWCGGIIEVQNAREDIYRDFGVLVFVDFFVPDLETRLSLRVSSCWHI